jgi:hypothetical protein
MVFKCIDLSPAMELLTKDGWEKCDFRYGEGTDDEERRLIPMIPPDSGDDAAVLFIGRDQNTDPDKNTKSSYWYGIPLDLLNEADYVVLFALEEIYLFRFKASFLRDLYERLTEPKIDDKGRWHVNVYFAESEKRKCCAIVPCNHSEQWQDINEFVVNTPDGRPLGEWYESGCPTD